MPRDTPHSFVILPHIAPAFDFRRPWNYSRSSPPKIRKVPRTNVLGTFVFVGEPGIEPGPHAPKARTLPLCYTPSELKNKSVLLFILRTKGWRRMPTPTQVHLTSLVKFSLTTNPSLHTCQRYSIWLYSNQSPKNIPFQRKKSEWLFRLFGEFLCEIYILVSDSIIGIVTRQSYFERIVSKRYFRMMI